MWQAGAVCGGGGGVLALQLRSVVCAEWLLGCTSWSSVEMSLCQCVHAGHNIVLCCKKKKFPHSVSRRDTERREISWIYSSVWLSQDISCIVCVRPSSLHDSTLLHFVNLAGMCVRSGLFVSAAHAFTVQ